MKRKVLKKSPSRMAALEALREANEERKRKDPQGIGLGGWRKLLTPDEKLDIDNIPKLNPRSHRPAIADPMIRELIIKKIREGNYPTVAAEYAGVTSKQLRLCLEKGRVGQNSWYYEFWCDVRQAEADAEISRLSMLSEAAEDDWKAQLEIMSRRWPERWGNKVNTRVEVTGSVEHKLRDSFATKILEDPVSRDLARKLITRQGSVVDGEYAEVDDAG